MVDLKWFSSGIERTTALEITLAQLAAQPPDLTAAVRAFLAGRPSHLMLDGGRLVVAHAGLPTELQGRDSRRVWAFALYGDVDRRGTDENGLAIRRDWIRRDWIRRDWIRRDWIRRDCAAGYTGAALVAYGHTPVRLPRWKNRTVNLDTGCVFGGALTALRYPELETLSVPAQAVYRDATRALLKVEKGERGL